MGKRRLVVSALAGCALLESARRARTRKVEPPEERVFQLVNGAPNGLHSPLWAVMQSGSLGSVFVVAGLLTWRGRSGAGKAALIAGTAVWGGVKAVKPRVGRGRPAHHLDGVAVRGEAQTGLGYPSGHAAVSLTLALIAMRDEPPAVRGAAVAAAATTGIARMYVGAHLPLDIVGGFAIGVITGEVVNAIRR
jgi:membrane-associated phospholipid phosphatase